MVRSSLLLIACLLPGVCKCQTFLDSVNNLHLEFSEEIKLHCDLPVTPNAPDKLYWKVWESANARRCQLFQVGSDNSLYREFGYDGTSSYLFRPSDAGKLILKKGYLPAYNTFLDLRHPLYLLFPADYFTAAGRSPGPMYIPLLKDFQRPQKNSFVTDSLTLSDLSLPSKIISSTANLKIGEFVTQGTTLFLGSKSNSKIIAVQDPNISFPLAWVLKSTDPKATRSLVYEVLELQTVKLPNGMPLVIPKKTKLSFMDKSECISDDTFTISVLDFNDPNIDQMVQFDPARASIIEDVDAATLIKVPK
jgi:hypothetical protein